MASRTVSFNGNDLALSVPGLMITSVLPNRFPNRTLNSNQVANSDKSVMNAAYYKDKKINVLAEIGRDTRQLLDASIDILYGILQVAEAALNADVGLGTRTWTATLDNVTISDQAGGHCSLDIEFQCSTPFGQDTTSTQLFDTSLTGATSNTPFVVGGTAYWQQPQITITLSALTGGTNKVVTVGNTSIGQAVSITRTWTAGDVIVIDSILKKVTVNGVEVAFTGAIPEWQGGITPLAGSMDYSDTLTTRTRRMVGLYFKRYV